MSLPSEMTAIEITEFGGPDVLKPVKRPVPRPGAGEVVIRVRAAGVNRPDLSQRAGSYPPPPGASDLPGLEVAGEIAAVGEGPIPWSIGDKVCALTPGGGYAEYCKTAATHCLPIPGGLDWVKAAALCETHFTVWTNVFDRGRLQRNETLLIHGGASGIGTTAIQIAREWGAKIYATVGTPEKAKAVEALGCKRAINYKTEDFVEVIKEETGGKGADVILDMVCGDYVPRNLQALAVDGRLVIIALLGGAKAEVNFAQLMVRRQTITGSTLRPQSVDAKAAIARSLHRHVWPMLEAGKIGPIIQGVYPLEDAAGAHAALEAGDHVGKFVLTLDA